MTQYFHPEEIVPGLPGVVLLSHSKLASALVETAEFIYGKIENIAAFGFEDEDTPEAYTQAYTQAMEKLPEGTIVLVDIFGGSPSNNLMLHAKRSGLAVCALSGMSLPMVITAVSLREEQKGQELLEALLEEVPAMVVNITEKLQ